MAIPRFEEDVEVISKLGDVPGSDNGMSTQQLKNAFDAAAVKIKNYINNILLPGIESSVSEDGLLSQVAKEMNKLLPLSGGTMTGAINMNSKRLYNLKTPTDAKDAVPKDYVDQSENNAKAYADNRVNNFSATSNLKTYNTLAQIGLSGTVTVDAVCEALPENSILQLENNQSAGVTDAPSTYNNLYFFKSVARCMVLSVTTGTMNPNLHMGSWHTTSRWSGWNQLVKSKDFEYTSGNGTRDTTNTKSASELKYYKYGRIVIARFEFEMASTANGTYTTYQVATGFPNATASERGACLMFDPTNGTLTSCVCEVTSTGALRVHVRSSMASKGVIGSVVYISES